MLLTYDPRTEAEKLTAFKILKLARPDHLSDGKSIEKFNDNKRIIKLFFLIQYS